MVRQVVVPEKKPSPAKYATEADKAIAPLATSGLLIGPRDLGGATKSEATVAELIAKDQVRDDNGNLIDEEGNLKKVPVLRNGKWVYEVAGGGNAVRKFASPGVGGSLPVAGRRSTASFELRFEGSASLGMTLVESDGRGDARPPSGYRVVVGSVNPGSAASKLHVKPGWAVLAVNGTTTVGMGRKEVLKLLGAHASAMRAACWGSMLRQHAGMTCSMLGWDAEVASC